MMTPFVYTPKMDEDLLELEKTIIQPVAVAGKTVLNHWKKVHKKIKEKYPSYPSSWKALYEHAKFLQRKAAGKGARKSVYTTKMDELMLELENLSNRQLPARERWANIHSQFLKKFPDFKFTWAGLSRRARHLRGLANTESKVAAQSSQQSEGDKPQEEDPLPAATSDLPRFDSFDSNTDPEYESDGHDALLVPNDSDDLPESLDNFNVSSDMLKTFTNDPMDVFDDQEERIDQDEPAQDEPAQDDQRVVKRRKITIRVDSDVSTPPQVSMLEVLAF
jgi:hypothetical protein